MRNITIKPFNELTGQELYQILRLRSEVFVLEQNCVYQDLDNKDQNALHLFIMESGNAIGYTRIFAAGDYFIQASFGRVVVKEKYRNDNIGHLLIEETVKAIKLYFNTSQISISAQKHLKKFYESHNFEQTGQVYLEDEIPHIKMILK